MLRRAALLAAPLALFTVDADAQTVVDTTLTWTSTFAFANAQSARFDPFDLTSYYVGRRGGAGDGVYRVGFTGRAERIATGSNVAALLTDGSTTSVFFSEDFGGVIYRVDTSVEPATRSTWVSGLHSGDDDPVGMAIAPPFYTGGLVTPGTAVVVDRGFNGADQVWAWSATVAQVQQLLVPDLASFVDPVDVVFDTTNLYIIDTGEGGAGRIFSVDGTGTFGQLVVTPALVDPVGAVLDPVTFELLVLDAGTDTLVAVDTMSGAVRTLVESLAVGGAQWAGVDVRADGSEILVTSGAQVYTFSRCTTALTAANDCDASGVLDRCELASGLANDCNANGVPDTCDISSGASTDCDGDGVPDDCPSCPPVEVVVALDTSASMDDEAAALCTQLADIRTELEARGIEVTSELLGISAAPGGAYACLEDHVINRYGTVVPGAPPAGNETLGMCPGGNEVASEDWGRAVSVVAGTKVWTPGTVRVVVPIADEGPWCGDPLNAFDTDAITHAVATSTAARVRVSPITGTGSSQGVVNHAVTLATGTGGLHQRTTASDSDIPRNVLTLVRNACFAAVDCNGNQVVDSCDIVNGGSLDCDSDGTPDECQDPPPDCPPPRDGGVDAGVVPDAGDVDAGDDRDGGARDGSAVRDGGAAARDAGAVARDGGSATRDAGSITFDAGTGEIDEESCDCRTTHGRGGLGAAWLLLLGLFVGARPVTRGRGNTRG
ncbi:MAG: hypothetical protein RMA76_06825 [Deltaproteobacteria bacterium]|jgi:hypothetical protein